MVDCETTGLDPTKNRIAEISIVHLDPKQRAVTMAFDSVINPRLRMSSGGVHGLTDSDIENAPCFEEVAGDIIDALKGRVLAYNSPFDVGFLQLDFGRVSLSVRHTCAQCP